MKRFHFLSVMMVALIASSTSAQCVDWNTGFQLPGADNDVRVSISFGGPPSAPNLYIGGTFSRVNGVDARRLAKWDGVSWSQFAVVGVADSSPMVNAMVVWNDGTGPALYVGGGFNDVDGVPASNIARWDGTTWTSLGLGVSGAVWSLAVFDDGSGPALYVGGGFTSAGGNTAFRMARWNGTTWSTPGPNGANGEVLALKVHDDGTGPALYAGGDFTFLGVSANRLAKWNGTTWSALPGSFNDVVTGLESWNDGTGLGLYACGAFTQVQGVAAKVARWNGTTWAGVGGGLSVSSGFARAEAIRTFNDGAGGALYVCGQFDSAGGNPASGIAKWNGSTWSALGSGLSTATTNTGALSLGTWDVPGAEQLLAGGFFRRAGGEGVEGFAAWRASWSTLGSGGGVIAPARAVVLHDDGTGPAIYVGGDFLAAAGSVNTVRIGRWNGSNLTPLGSGADNRVEALASFNDGSGPLLFASGIFTIVGGVPALRCAKWNGSAWSSAAGGLTSGVPPHLVVYDAGTGPVLYDVRGLQQWNGTAWVATGWTPPISITSITGAATVQEPGGQRLYISGTRTVLPMVTERRVAKFDGSTWTLLPGLFDVEPQYVCAFDDGTGNTAYVFGSFTMIDATPFASAAKWNGTAWVPLGSGLVGNLGGAGTVKSSAVIPDVLNSISRLYVAGAFVTAGGNTATNIASWDGTSWSAVAGGLDDQTDALCVVNPLGNAELWAVGLFRRAGTKSSSRIARYSRTCTTSLAYCSGDGSDTACPCGNPGLSGRGCDNTVLSGGAGLTQSGIASISADTLVLRGSNAVPFGPGLYYQGSTTANALAPFGVVFGNGLRCAGGSTPRLEIRPVADASGASATTVPIHVLGSASAGDVRNYQLWYRDSPNFGSCTSGFNFSNAISLTWVP